MLPRRVLSLDEGYLQAPGIPDYRLESRRGRRSRWKRYSVEIVWPGPLLRVDQIFSTPCRLRAFMVKKKENRSRIPSSPWTQRFEFFTPFGSTLKSLCLLYFILLFCESRKGLLFFYVFTWIITKVRYCWREGCTLLCAGARWVDFVMYLLTNEDMGFAGKFSVLT